jgi:D-alanyl-D-alanine endopeptidase (penicillin-binding protein 7)
MVAQSTGLTETAFIKNMNNRLSEWSADNTHLSDVTGLDEKNVSSPRDLLKIFTKVASDSSLKTILGKSSFELKSTLNKKTISRTIQNTNQLISNPSDDYRIIASKTGYTDEAGATLIMLIESKKDKKEYVIITMGGTDYAHRFNEPNRISSLAVKNSTTTQVAKQN